jgi:hypothetical protein
MDPYERCHIEGLQADNRTMLAERERLVFAWCCEHSIPLAFGIGGGYTNTGFQQTALANLHRLTLYSAIGYSEVSA